jgi:hypothetical protein
LLSSFIQGIHPGLRPLLNVRNKLIFYGEELLAPRPTPKLEDHPLLAVHNCLFNIFTSVLHNWRASPPLATWGHTMPWWQGTHLTWALQSYIPCTPYVAYVGLLLRTERSVWELSGSFQHRRSCGLPQSLH